MPSLYSRLFVLASAVAVVRAQTFTDLPKCAQDPVISSLGNTGCQATNFSCICNDASFIASLKTVITQDCNAADQQATLHFAETLCGSYNPNIANIGSGSSTSAPLPQASSSAAVAVTTSPMPYVYAPTTSAVATSSALATTSQSTMPPMASASMTATYSCSNTTNYTASTSTMSPAIYSGKAASFGGAKSGLLAIGMAAAAMGLVDL